MSVGYLGFVSDRVVPFSYGTGSAECACTLHLKYRRN